MSQTHPHHCAPFAAIHLFNGHLVEGKSRKMRLGFAKHFLKK